MRSTKDTRDNGRSNDCKGQLECSKDKGWKAGVTPHLHVQVHPKAVVKVADERTVFSEGPWKSKDYPSQSHNAHGHDTHHHGVDDVRVSDQAAVEEAKPCCHQEHKCRWGQDPGNCTCVHSIFCQSWVGHCASYSGQGTTTIALWQSNKIRFKTQQVKWLVQQHIKRNSVELIPWWFCTVGCGNFETIQTPNWKKHCHSVTSNFSPDLSTTLKAPGKKRWIRHHGCHKPGPGSRKNNNTSRQGKHA